MTKRLLFLSVLAILLSNTAWAYDFKENGIYYNVLCSDDQTCEVTGLSTSNSNYSAYQGNIDIPNSVEYEGVTYTVSGIGDYAFYECSRLTDVTIPKSVTSIGSYTFYQCSGLTEIIIPGSVTSIGDYAFYSCTCLTSITIPNSVSSNVGDYTFYNCKNLMEVTIGESVVSIGERAFYGCTGLTQVTIGESVTSIGDWAFRECTSLTQVTIPNSVISIGSCTFYDCIGLTIVTIGESVTSIGAAAFRNCSGLTEVNFYATACTYAGASSSYIRAFDGCTNISTVNFGDNVTIIPDYLFESTELTSVTIPDSVTSIGICAFYGCTNIIQVTIGNSVNEIGNQAFGRCTGLTEVTFNATACTSAGPSSSSAVFNGCTNISTVNIGEAVTILPDYLLYNCSSMERIFSLNPEPPTCGSNAFYNVPAKTCVVYVPEGSLGAYAIADGWKEFYNIVETEVDAVADITNGRQKEDEDRYTLDGKKISTTQKGVNIIRYSDGTSKKVLVK